MPQGGGGGNWTFREEGYCVFILCLKEGVSEELISSQVMYLEGEVRL